MPQKSPPCAPLTHPVRGAAREEVPDDGAGVPAAADAEAEAVAVVMQHHHLHLRPLALQLKRRRKGEDILHENILHAVDFNRDLIIGKRLTGSRVHTGGLEYGNMGLT